VSRLEETLHEMGHYVRDATAGACSRLHSSILPLGSIEFLLVACSELSLPSRAIRVRSSVVSSEEGKGSSGTAAVSHDDGALTCLLSLQSSPGLLASPGNWHEDQSGCDLMSRTAALAASQAPYPPRLHYPETTTHSTHTAAGHDIVRASVYEEKCQPRMSPEVSRELLFPHKGADPLDRRYQTSYQTSYARGHAHAPVDRTIKKTTAQEDGSEEGMREQSRFRTYRTASSDAYTAQNSVLAIAADQSANQFRVQGGARGSQLAQSLEANYRKLRLRKD
jgi:hypothetical protein